MAFAHSPEDFLNLTDFDNNSVFDSPIEFQISSDNTQTNLDFGMTNFEPINKSAPAQTSDSNPRTISPKDLFLDSTSAPPSAALTNITTPGTQYDSPFNIAYSTDTSPMFEQNELGDESENWGSLFAVEHSPNQEPQAFPDLSPSGTIQESIEAGPPTMSRTASSGNSSSRGHTRHSSSSGVAPRRRDKPLPPIVVDDPSDIVAIKRARNTAAARKSRERKVQRFEEMEAHIHQLSEEVEKWKGIALRLGHQG